MPLQPTTWIETNFITVSRTALQRIQARRPYADASTYHNGKKLGGITSIAPCTRAFNSRDGSPSITTCSFEVFDRDGFWRNLQEDPDTQYMVAELAYMLASVGAHSTGVAGRPIFYGYVTETAPVDERKYRVTFQPRIGARSSPFNADDKMLKRTFKLANLPQLPREFDNTVIPFLWGELSDSGTPSVIGTNVALGMATPVAVGFTSATPAPTYLLPPTNLQVTVTGTGARIPVRIGVTFIATGGGETTITALDVASYPRNPGPFPGTATHYATWTWDDPNSPSYPGGCVQKSQVFIDTLDGTGWHRLDAASLTYTDDGDDAHNKSLYPGPPLVNTAQCNTTGVGSAKRLYVLLGHKGTLLEVYGSDLQPTPGYTLIGQADPNFDFGPNNDGIEVVIAGESYWGFFATGPVADAHDDGSFPFRVNMCGWHEDNDTTKPIIDQYAYVWQDVITQLTGNNSLGYYTGPRLTVPVFRTSPTIPVVETDRFDQAQNQTITQLGDGEGFKSCVYLHQGNNPTWREWETQMGRGFKTEYSQNMFGQEIISRLDVTASPTAGTILRKFTHINSVPDPGKIQENERKNIIRYRYDLHPLDGYWRSGWLEVKDQASINEHGELTLEMDMPYTRHSSTAAAVAMDELADRSVGPKYVTVNCRVKRAVALELGANFRVKHDDLYIDDAEVPLYLRETTYDDEGKSVTLRGRVRDIPVTGMPSGFNSLSFLQSKFSGVTGNLFNKATDALPLE